MQATGSQRSAGAEEVIVAFSNQVAISDTLQGALEMVFGDAPATLEESPGDGTPDEGTGVSDEAMRLLERTAQRLPTPTPRCVTATP